MINRVNMDGIKAYGENIQLPKGGYVCKIMGAEVKQNSVGQYVQLSCDITEGEYKDFYATDYRNQTGEDKKWHCSHLLNVPKDDGTERDGWTKRAFQTFIDAIEGSNPGYHFDWDETKLKGLAVGGLFNVRQYKKNNGDIGEATNLASFTTVEKIRSGKFRLPKDRLLPPDPAAGKQVISTFRKDEDEDLPF